MEGLKALIAKKRKAEEELKRETKSVYMTEGQKEKIREEKIIAERKAEEEKVLNINCINSFRKKKS